MCPDTPHILIVDDQDNWRLALTILLESEGYQVSQASNYKEAKTRLRRTTFDLVVLDVRLEDQDTYNVDGLDLLNTIRAKSPATRIIILTGYPDSLKTTPPADAVILKAPHGKRFDSVGFKRKVKELLRKARTP